MKHVMTVLLVDDDPEELARLREIVVGCGHEVITAASGAEALGAVGRQVAWLAVIDTELPDMTGLDVLRHIRLTPELRRICVILAWHRQPTDPEVFRGFSYFTEAQWLRPLDHQLLTRFLDRFAPASDALPEWSDYWNQRWDKERMES